jgi:hypothetical protein
MRGRARSLGFRRDYRGVILFLLVVLAIAGARCSTSGKAPASGSTEMTRAIVDPYLKIDEALAADSVTDIRARAGEIATAAAGLGAFAMRIDTAALQLASADGLDDARQKFGTLSEAIDAYMTNQHLTPPVGVRVAFCPMVMKPWLQQDGPLKNPYYGSQMLTCGSFRN